MENEDYVGGGIGAGGGSQRGKIVPNVIKQEHKRRSQNPTPQNLEIQEDFDEPIRVCLFLKIIITIFVSMAIRFIKVQVLCSSIASFF